MKQLVRQSLHHKLVRLTLVALTAGVRLEMTGGPGGSTVRPLVGVVGATPMSPSMFIVACSTMLLGSPAPFSLSASPRVQWFVPVAQT